MFLLIRTVGITLLLFTSTIKVSAGETEFAVASECECKPTPQQIATPESAQDSSSPLASSVNSIDSSREQDLSKEVEKEDLSIADENTGQQSHDKEESEENLLINDENETITVKETDENLSQQGSEEEHAEAADENVREETGPEIENQESIEVNQVDDEIESVEKLDELFDHTQHANEEAVSVEAKSNEEPSDENTLQEESMEKIVETTDSYELQSEEKNEEITSKEMEEQETLSKEGEEQSQEKVITASEDVEITESPEQIQSDEDVKELVEEESGMQQFEENQSVEKLQDEISKEVEEEKEEAAITVSKEVATESEQSVEAGSEDIEQSGEAGSEDVEQSAEALTEDVKEGEKSIEEGEKSAEAGEGTAEQSAETGEDIAEKSAEDEQSIEAVEDVAEQSAEGEQSVESVVEQSAETAEDIAEQSAEVEQSEEGEKSVEVTEDTAEQSVETTEETGVDAEQSDRTSGELVAEQSAEMDNEQSEEEINKKGVIISDESSETQTDKEKIIKEEVISKEEITSDEGKSQETIDAESQEETAKSEEGLQLEELPEEEELTMIMEIPEKLRPREHMVQILHLHEDSKETEQILSKTVEHTLKELKKLYEAAIKPLEILYKYRDLSNRHFGDPEIFSKPLILFMGPWSGGKSTIINYLLENEYKHTALRTGADPSPAYFNIVMWGEDSEILDGTQLAADWTFSGLQKFGQVLLDRLKGLKLNHPLLQKVNIVEIPGILEIRKQVERMFPFNDACQWFIDRADIIFLVYDPSKLDIGPETEAILDQLKGREMQTRIILNKADQVKPEELMRVQGTLIWNISPLMSSTEPPVMYSTSLWSLPYEAGSPTRLLHAQEKAFLSDLRSAIDKRVENKIAGARRFAVRVRNHAKMVDCYLTTYYNHKSFFDNKKHVSDDIIEHPQNYHIYEGLSTLTNISRYDLPDPDVYRDFFRLNPVYDFQQLSSTCTYFRGCPINRLDLAIAYDLPELVGKYKKSVEELLKSYNAKK